MFKDLIELQFKNNFVLNLLNFKNSNNTNFKYNIKQYGINCSNNINTIFSKSILTSFLVFFSKYLRKSYLFKDLLIFKINKYNLYLMKKYYFFIKLIKACLLKLFNCFKYCWKTFNKKKFNLINVLRVFIIFLFYKKIIKIKKQFKFKKLNFFFKNKKVKRGKKKGYIKKFKKFSLVSKLHLLKLKKIKNKILLKIKIKKRLYYEYKTLIPPFKIDKKKREEWKQLKLQRLKEKKKIKRIKASWIS